MTNDCSAQLEYIANPRLKAKAKVFLGGFIFTQNKINLGYPELDTTNVLIIVLILIVLLHYFI